MTLLIQERRIDFVHVFVSYVDENGIKFASLGPFKGVSKPFTFQCLSVHINTHKTGRTVEVYASSFKFAPVIWRDGSDRYRNEIRERHHEAGGLAGTTGMQ